MGRGRGSFEVEDVLRGGLDHFEETEGRALKGLRRIVQENLSLLQNNRYSDFNGRKVIEAARPLLKENSEAALLEMFPLFVKQRFGHDASHTTTIYFQHLGATGEEEEASEEDVEFIREMVVCDMAEQLYRHIRWEEPDIWGQAEGLFDKKMRRATSWRAAEKLKELGTAGIHTSLFEGGPLERIWPMLTQFHDIMDACDKSIQMGALVDKTGSKDRLAALIAARCFPAQLMEFISKEDHDLRFGLMSHDLQKELNRARYFRIRKTWEEHHSALLPVEE
jgi:hypothetical protein